MTLREISDRILPQIWSRQVERLKLIRHFEIDTFASMRIDTFLEMRMRIAGLTRLF